MRLYLTNKRKELGITQAELAEKLGVSTIYIRKIENSDRNPSISLMLKYEELFNVSMKELFPDIFFE